jgi:hypothetical protein
VGAFTDIVCAESGGSFRLMKRPMDRGTVKFSRLATKKEKADCLSDLKKMPKWRISVAST